MDKIIQFKKVYQEKIRRQYELEDCSDDLIELAEKLIQCNPGGLAGEKKESIKAQYLKKADQFRVDTQAPASQELSDEELDAAAGGLLKPEDTIKDPQKE